MTIVSQNDFSSVMKLYLVHCGFYDNALSDGIFENHTNFFVAAESFDDAKIKAKLIPEFKDKRMHVDGIQEIECVEGHQVKLVQEARFQGKTIITSHKHRDLATKTPT